MEADFAGDTNFRASRAKTAHTVSLAAASIVLSGPSHVAYGQSVALQVSESGTAGTPTGNVTLLDGTAQLSQSPLFAGASTFTLSTLASGTHTFQASYNGDGNYASGNSNSLTVVVDPQPTTLALQATPMSASFGSIVQLQATLSAPAGPLGGTVVFVDGSQQIGSGAITSSGVVQLQISTLTIGTHSLTAQFPGSNWLEASSSLPVQVVITGVRTTTTLSAVPNPSYPTQPVALTASVISSLPSQPLAGTVRFFDGGSLLGDVPLTSLGAAVFTTSDLSIGPHAITATYLGSGVLVPSTSNVVQQVVLDSSFSVAVTPSQLSLQTQHHTSFSLTFTPLGQFSGTVAPGCGVLPAHATCRLGASTVYLSPGSGAQTISVYLDTSDVIGYASLQGTIVNRKAGQLALALCGPLFTGLYLFRTRNRRSRFQQLAGLILAIILPALLTSGCSGKYPSSVTPGSYTLHFTGTSLAPPIAQSANMGLTVTP